MTPATAFAAEFEQEFEQRRRRPASLRARRLLEAKRSYAALLAKGARLFIGASAGHSNRDVLVRYIIQQGTINPSADANWKFAAMPGTTVLFETGPKAREFLGDVKSVKIEDAGEGAEGFAKFRITL